MIITTGADLVKDRRFVALQSLIKEETCPVIRGKFGCTQSVSVWDLVVGDVILLSAGARVPTDCVLISASDLQIQEGHKDGDEAQATLAKTAVQQDGSGDPFLLADSLILRGKCKALVCRVGARSTRGPEAPELPTDVDTPLQAKLENLSTHFRRLSIYAALAIFLLMTILLIIQVANFDVEAREDAGKAGTTSFVISRVTSMVNFCVVLLVVSIPEGLPLAIGVSLAFSVMKMFNDKLLVRELDAPEKMGQAEELCCGKTGTITKGDMKVAQFHCDRRLIRNTRKSTMMHCELSEDFVERIKESILYNCEARVEMDTTTYVPVGNSTEVALLKFLQDAEVPVHLLIQKKLDKTRAAIPFSPTTKRSVTAVEHPDQPGQVFIYVKGAPELLVDQCDEILVNDGHDGFSSEEKDQMKDHIKEMAQASLRVMGFAYTCMSLDNWSSTFEGQGGTPERALEDAVDNGQLPLAFVGAFGLKDSLRAKVPSCVKHARENAQMTVRLVSGDHIETARAVALKSGVLRPEEAGRNYAIMHAEQFREVVGALQTSVDDDTGAVITRPENFAAFKEVARNLRVLARANAEDKYLLVQGLRSLGRAVAVTGDGVNDVDALRSADVGLAMGNGVSAAKESASLILVNDDFEACVRAVMWGRNIYHNITRFLQFQVTVNLSALLTIAVGILMFNQSPMNSVQLLWVNLIMDTFAALALASEPPLPSVIDGPPFKMKNLQILTPTVWRQVLGLSFWNAFVMVMLMIFGRMIGGLDEYDRSTPLVIPAIPTGFDSRTTLDYTSDDLEYMAASAKVRHFTYIFNTFVLMQVFNLINCRKIGRRDFNVFEEFFHNWYFIIIFLLAFGAQFALVNWFSGITSTVPLARSEWGACICVGTTPILVSAILKLTPERWVNKIPTGSMIDENSKAADPMSKFKKQKTEEAAIPLEEIEVKKEGSEDDFAQAP